MIDPEEIMSDIVDVAAAIPKPVRKSLFKAAADLIGEAVAIPTAKLRQFSQSIEIDTQGKLAMKAALIESAVNKIKDNNGLAIIAADEYMPTRMRKLRNKLGVLLEAEESLKETASDDSSSTAAPPEEDWMNVFTRHAEDASSEHLRILFGKILAGKILRPERFGPATLRTLSELDQSLAKDFSEAWNLSVGNAVDCNDFWEIDPGYSIWKRLTEAGLMAASPSTRYLPEPLPTGPIWCPAAAGKSALIVHFNIGSKTDWRHIDFTRVGQDLGSLLPEPDYTKNLRNMGERLNRHGVTRIELVEGTNKEVLYELA
ncbi:DUF2806 domain-containing protein [Pseudomonas monteilii]